MNSETIIRIAAIALTGLFAGLIAAALVLGALSGGGEADPSGVPEVNVFAP